MEKESVLFIEKNHPDMAQFQWVAKALMAKKSYDGREVFKYFCIDNKKAIATDGNRLHQATLETSIADGVYSVEKLTKTSIILKKVDMDYPDYKMVIPTYKGIACEIIELVRMKEVVNTISCNYARVVRAMSKTSKGEEVGLNHLFFADLVGDCVADMIIPGEGENPLTYNDVLNKRLAVIIPVKF